MHIVQEISSRLALLRQPAKQSGVTVREDIGKQTQEKLVRISVRRCALVNGYISTLLQQRSGLLKAPQKYGLSKFIHPFSPPIPESSES